MSVDVGDATAVTAECEAAERRARPIMTKYPPDATA